MSENVKVRSVEDLKQFLVSKGINFTPYTQEQIDEKKAELGRMPALLEEYYLKIGWFSEISNQGYGCHIDSLDSLYIMEAEELQKEYECVNEVDDYLVFGREAVSVDEFAIRVNDFQQNNLALYIAGDSTFEDTEEEQLYWGKLEEEPNISSMFNIIIDALS